MRKALLLLMVLLATLAGAGPALADDASLGRSGETIFPVGEPSVRMVSETVLLNIDPEQTRVDLSFTFANGGPAKQVLMGFPLQQKFEGRGHPELNDFQTLIDGAPTAVETAQAGGGDYPGWITWPVPFAENQTRVVQNSYWGTNSYWSNGDTEAGYILKTGAVWQGTIGQATVRAKLNRILPPDLFGVSPAGYRWDGDDLVWEWRDFEPVSDIELLWNQRAWQSAVLETMPGAPVAFPPGPPLDGLTEWRQAHPNTTGRPDAIDLAILRLQFQNGEHAAVKKGVQQALDAGLKEPLIAYLSVSEGLRQPQEVLAWPDLNPATIRWLQDRAGLEGAPSAVPTLKLVDGLNLTVGLGDPDGDIADWGLKVWLSPDESLTPVATAPVDASRAPRSQTHWEEWVGLPATNSSEYWARAWVVDGRGHRQDTGLVKLSLPGQPEPEPVPAPPHPAVERLSWWWLPVLCAPLILGMGVTIFHYYRRT